MLVPYLFSFLTTIISEQAVFALFGQRSRHALYAVAVANALTHPILHVFLYILLAIRAPLHYPLLAGELCVIFVEACILSRVLEKPIRYVVSISALMNFVSFSIGEIILLY
ncbi:hypothetical protein HYV71_05120 [Candidatus Uhrbacteria bacterium]|nr:hypothetical protein [Candidatus Uhrbacteria bacterium]